MTAANHIEVKGISDPQLLAYYAREQAATVESLAACDLEVDRVASGVRGPLFSAHLTLTRAGLRTTIDEINKDAFLAVRDAFDIARMWIADHTGAEDAWSLS